MKRFRSYWRYGFAILALGLLVMFVGASEIVDTLSGANLLLVGLYAAGLALTSLLYATQVWRAFHFAGYPCGWRHTTRAAVNSWSVGLITPARAGDLTLPYFMGDAVPGGIAVAVVATEKLMSLAWLATAGLVVSTGLAADSSALPVVAAAVLAAVLVLLATARSDILSRALTRWGTPSFRRLAADTLDAVAGLLRQVRYVGFTVGAVTVRWMVVFMLNLLLFHAVGYEPGLVYVVAATSIGRLLALVPVSVSGVGVKEPIQIVIYGLADIPGEAVVAVSVLGIAATYLVAAILPLVVRSSVQSTT